MISEDIVTYSTCHILSLLVTYSSVCKSFWQLVAWQHLHLAFSILSYPFMLSSLVTSCHAVFFLFLALEIGPYASAVLPGYARLQILLRQERA